MANPVRFVIFGNDKPLLSIGIGKEKQEPTPHLSEFILYSSLDVIDERKRTSNAQYLKVVDKSNGYFVSAFCTPGNIL